MNSDTDFALDIVDFCLMRSQRWASGGRVVAGSLDPMPKQAGFAWTVGSDAEGVPCLHRRVDETFEHMAKAAMSEARHLHHAWHKVYGRSADPSGAYREAVRAVEAAAKPIVTPSDPVATLGKMIGAMRDKPSKWVADLGSVEEVADMMGLLWTSQLDRHGTDDESVPLAVSAGHAESGVQLAVVLVQWFRNGNVRQA